MLIIKNPNDIKGMNLVDGRYTLYLVETHDDRYRFEFRDGVDLGWKCIDVIRNPKWDSERGENMYRVDNGRFNSHWISAKWFAEIPNVKFTFTESLKVL